MKEKYCCFCKKVVAETDNNSFQGKYYHKECHKKYQRDYYKRQRTILKNVKALAQTVTIDSSDQALILFAKSVLLVVTG